MREESLDVPFVTYVRKIVFVTFVNTVENDAKCALNVREFPEDLKRKCKIAATHKRLTLTNFIIQSLKDATADVELKSDGFGNSKV